MLLYQVPSEIEMAALGANLAQVIVQHAIIFLHGPLGAGKTMLVRGFLRGLHYAGKVKSPTYTLVESYDIAHKKIFHFDFYRLQDPQELEHIGIRDYFALPAICLIEWPDKGVGFLPAADIACYISMTEAIRNVRLEANSTHGEEILAKLNSSSR
jgi:tRNA threonylcarbamoyladenosine biosynthesis protein TsaE